MGIIGAKLEVDFVISTGDNFYDRGLKGTDDPAFEESFSKIYTAPSLQKEWYSGKYKALLSKLLLLSLLLLSILLFWLQF